MPGVYEILNHLTGDSIYTHQIPRVVRECKPVLLKQFPQLAEIDASAVTPENCAAFMNDLSQRYPAQYEVEPMPPGEHYEIDPVSELAELVHPSKIIVVKVNP
jgi:ornithine cyclodeaminase/alanine dehydrogenase-like protein (mu-crystallin family)